MFHILILSIINYVYSQPAIPPPERPECSAGWQSPDLTYVPSINQCNDYTPGVGISCQPNNPFTCTGRNPFCATAGDRTFKCCSDIIQDSDEIGNLTDTQIKPICPAGAIPYKMPHVLLCDPSIVNMCPYDYKCVEAANGHLLPPDGRSLCCKTSTLYSFASVFGEAKITPRIVPNPPLSAIEYVTLNVHTSAKQHAPEIRIGDHFVLTPYKLYEPAYLKKVKLFADFGHGSYVHVLLFDRKLWIVLVFKTVNPLTRLYILSSKDLHKNYKSVTDFLKSDTGNMLGTPVAGTYFYLSSTRLPLLLLLLRVTLSLLLRLLLLLLLLLAVLVPLLPLLVAVWSFRVGHASTFLAVGGISHCQAGFMNKTVKLLLILGTVFLKFHCDEVEDVLTNTKVAELKENVTETPKQESTDPQGEDEDRLVIDLFRDYNFLIRPVRNVSSPPVVVDFGVAMILLINVDEKNQILQTNVWLTMKWNDFQLSWNPEDYGNISNLHVPSDRVWLPDIVLFNNADGNYEVSFKSNVFVDHYGDVTWVPPAMFKSSCRIDVEWFPFDEQCCTLVFGSWTYNSEEVRLHWYNNIQAVQLHDYSYSGIWDVIDVPGQLIHRPLTKENKIVFNVVIRRKTLFYTVILIIPTVLMAFLSVMAFYLPVDSGEKASLTISLLLALVVFLLLVSKILPPTSNIPLMGKYLLLAFVLNIMAVVATVVIVNIYFRSALSHKMPTWVRVLFLEFLPHLLVMKRPERIPIFNGYFVEEYCASEIFDASLVMPSMTATMLPFLQVQTAIDETTSSKANANPESAGHHENCTKWKKRLSIRMSRRRAPKATIDDDLEDIVDDSNGNHISVNEKISKEMKTTIEAIAYIAEHMKREMSLKKMRDDWKYVAMVLDRLLLLIFFGVTLGGTLGIICSAPHVFDFIDQERIIEELKAKYLPPEMYS
ncbi:unnamed protein product [Caenorhabditis bovis]|uniref:Uncharacterized protein n=1 Tax=Caenorhabditis bovis TaxID=2654633 RepID=A0A8S1EDV1_9PELO|nr:unnamed protein product [Caenorhabditis bovis]